MFTKEYFINKFDAIPMSSWTRKWFLNSNGQSCALGFCGCRGPWDIEHEPEAIALINLFASNGEDITTVNDLSDEHPKMAVLTALRSFK